MGKFDIARLVEEDYAARLSDFLSTLGAVDSAKWAEVAACCGEPALIRVGEGHWVLELWHTEDLGASHPAKSAATAYAKRWGQAIPDAMLYAGDVVSAYCDLVADGVVPKGGQINVTCSTRHPLFVGAVIAQASGLPLYTVVGVDEDGKLRKYKQTGRDLPQEWRLLSPYLAGKDVQTALKDVLDIQCDAEDAEEAMVGLADEEGYLLHPMGARAYYASTVYREEAESRNPILSVAPFHPYVAYRRVCTWMCERTPKRLDEALKLLELETGWEIPAELTNGEMAQAIIDSIKNTYGETI